MVELFNVLVAVVIVGGLLWVINIPEIPIHPAIRRIGTGLILIAALIWTIRWLMGFLH